MGGLLVRPARPGMHRAGGGVFCVFSWAFTGVGSRGVWLSDRLQEASRGPVESVGRFDGLRDAVDVGAVASCG